MNKNFTSVRQFFILIFCLFSLSLIAQPPVISYQSHITAGLSSPVDLVNAGDGTNRLFIVEQAGIIRVAIGTTTSVFGNFGSTGADIISFSADSEEGLLSMAFHPDYNGTTNRFFFIYYTDKSSNISVTRYQTTIGNRNTVDFTTAFPIITIAHPGQTNHNGGKLNFGSDGYLYFATGDGGGGNDPFNNAQNGSSLLGKMIRIDINATSAFGNYAVPADNPYVTDDAIDDRIWAIGLRNPFRWSFDRANGNMWIGDVGQGAREEINFRPAAISGKVNYGWRCYEGYISTPLVPDCTPADYVPPVYDYGRDSGRSVTGGFVYRGTEYTTFKGYYIAADYSLGSVFILWPNGSGGFDSSRQTGLASGVVGFGEAEDGTLYTVLQSGIINKVVATGGTVLPVTLESLSAKAFAGYNELKWKTSFEQGTALFRIEYSTNNNNFQRVGEVAATRSSNGSNYSFRHPLSLSGDGFYRLAIEDDNGSVRYSSVVKLSAKSGGIKIYPTIVRNGLLTIEITQALQKAQVINASGSVVFEKDLRSLSGTTTISLPRHAKGVYVVQVVGDGVMKREKIVVEY